MVQQSRLERSGSSAPPVVRLLARSAPALIFVALAAIVIPTYGLQTIWNAQDGAISTANQILIFAILAVSTSGFIHMTGLPTIHTVATLGASSYAFLVAVTSFEWGYASSWLFAFAVGMAISLPIGAVSIRTQGMAFLMLTFGFSVFVVLGIAALREYTGGYMGLNLPPGDFLGGSLRTQYLVAVMFLALTLLVYGILRVSHFGRRTLAVRDNEDLAASLGLNAYVSRLLLFMIFSAFVAALGPMFVFQQQSLTPALFDSLSMAIPLYLMMLIGGYMTLTGPAVGAWIVILLPTYLAQVGLGDPNTQVLVNATAIVLIAICLPQGLGGAGMRLLQRLWPRLFLPALPAEARKEHQQSATGVAGGELEVVELHRYFGATRALEGVNFRVADGECVGLIGPNGSGKTTMLNCLSGFLPVTDGQVTFNKRPITTVVAHKRARAGIVRTFQQAESFGSFSVLESCLVAQTSTARALEHLTVCGLRDKALSPVDALSYGERRRLNVAMALGRDPRVLLLDEPAAGLSGPDLEDLSEVIRQVGRMGTTLVVIEHDMGFLAPLCERFVVLDHGVELAAGVPADVLRDPQVVEAYLGPAAETDLLQVAKS